MKRGYKIAYVADERIMKPEFKGISNIHCRHTADFVSIRLLLQTII